MNGPVLSVRDLSIHLRDGTALVQALSFDLAAGETLALVGESGCGKSVSALAVMGLLPPELNFGSGSSIRFENRELVGAPEARLRDLRGNRMAMVFQDALTALNPVMTIGVQITEMLLTHRGLTWRQANARALDLLKRVHIPDPEARLSDYPHRLSGGMRQRVMIAMALACDPILLVADEPTTALDVTVQAQILDLLREIQTDMGLAMILITHDLGVVGGYADRAIVMYSGTAVEGGRSSAILSAPRHRYTAGLIEARPHGHFWSHRHRLADIDGVVPAPRNRPPGCAFQARCSACLPECGAEAPPPHTDPSGHWASCFNPVPELVEA
ncbi:ABC transporter ATP-binding protein [Consotaella aegiceratis]|uniref:ABC transporter ATP-binding protein n=1 Tax=Consotaella aegiceratis TaxID=3097961 RepID=UPI002F3E7443